MSMCLLLIVLVTVYSVSLCLLLLASNRHCIFNVYVSPADCVSNCIFSVRLLLIVVVTVNSVSVCLLLLASNKQ